MNVSEAVAHIEAEVAQNEVRDTILEFVWSEYKPGYVACVLSRRELRHAVRHLSGSEKP